MSAIRDSYGEKLGSTHEALHITDKSESNVDHNGIQCTKTTVTNSATKLVLPEDATYLRLIYNSSDQLWISDVNTVASEGVTSFPISTSEYFSMKLKKGNEASIYAISDGSDIDVFIYSEVIA